MCLHSLTLHSLFFILFHFFPVQLHIVTLVHVNIHWILYNEINTSPNSSVTLIKQTFSLCSAALSDLIKRAGTGVSPRQWQMGILKPKINKLKCWGVEGREKKKQKPKAIHTL